MELRQDAARLIRAERRAVYLKMFQILADIMNFWLHLREYGIEDDYIKNSRYVHTRTQEYNNLLPELQICGSVEIRRQSKSLIATFTECSEVLLERAEVEVKEFEVTEKFEAQWQRALDATLKVYESENVNEKMKELVRQIKREMGDLVLEGDSVTLDR
jgi:hypothetical protein